MSLEESAWKLIDVSDADIDLGDQVFTLIFEGSAAGHWGGQADCNRISGRYNNIFGNKLDLRIEVSTYAGCAPESFYWGYSRFLSDTSWYFIDDDSHLTLYQQSGATLTFKPISFDESL